MPPPPARLGASSRLFLFYQGPGVGSLKPPSPPAGRQDASAQGPGPRSQCGPRGPWGTVSRAGKALGGSQTSLEEGSGRGRRRSRGGGPCQTPPTPTTKCLFSLLRQHPPRGAGTRPSRRSLRAWGGGLTHSITKLRSEEGRRESWGQTVPKLLCPFGQLLADPTFSSPGTQTPGSQGSKCAGGGGCVQGMCSSGPRAPHHTD